MVKTAFHTAFHCKINSKIYFCVIQEGEKIFFFFWVDYDQTALSRFPLNNDQTDPYGCLEMLGNKILKITCLYEPKYIYHSLTLGL